MNHQTDTNKLIEECQQKLHESILYIIARKFRQSWEKERRPYSGIFTELRTAVAISIHPFAYTPIYSFPFEIDNRLHIIKMIEYDGERPNFFLERQKTDGTERNETIAQVVVRENDACIITVTKYESSKKAVYALCTIISRFLPKHCLKRGLVQYYSYMNCGKRVPLSNFLYDVDTYMESL